MSLRFTRVASYSLSLLTLVALISLVFAVDPATLNQGGRVFALGLFFGFVMSACFSLLLALSLRFLGPERTALYQGAALRQSGLIALWVSAVVSAQYLRVLTWWVAALSLTFILLVELSFRYFLTTNHKR